MLDFVWNDLLINPMANALIVLSNVLFDNFGLALVAFTIGVRLVTYPLTLRQLRTTRAMQLMQPRLQEIQKKYKDPKRRQEEMMKLYREVGFNPLGCAVPFMVQIPIWIGLFQVIRRAVGSSPEALLGFSERLYDWSFISEAVPLSRTFLFLDLSSPSIPLALMVAVATFYQQKFSMGRARGAKDDRSASMNRTMLWMMPIMFGWFTTTVPSGLGIYWLVTSLFTVVTAYFYNGRPKVSARWLVSLEPLPISPVAGRATAMPAPKAEPPKPDEPPALVLDSPSDSTPNATYDTATKDDRQVTAAERKRRRRRRRRAAGRTSEGGPREGTGTSHGTSEP